MTSSPSSPNNGSDLFSQLRQSAELRGERGIILFDGKCRFCRRVVRSLLAHAPALRVCSVRSARGGALARAFGRIPEDTFGFLTARSVHFDVDAYVTILAHHRSTRWLARLIAIMPAFITHAIYHWISEHRPLMSKLLPKHSNTTIDADRFIPGGSDDLAD